MQLPNYFLADLPEGAELTPEMLRAAAQTLKRNRRQYLAERSTDKLIDLLGEIGESWLRPEYPFRELALEAGPAQTGFTRDVLARGIDEFFRELTRENLTHLVAQDLGQAKRLDRFLPDSTGPAASAAGLAASRAFGPDLIVRYSGGSLPNPIWMDIILGLLARSAQIIKCSIGNSFLPRMFAHSIYELDSKLGACLEIAEWKGGDANLDDAVLSEAGCVTVTGSDEAVAALRARTPPRARFIGYGHRVSFAYVTQEALSGFQLRRIAHEAARDIAAWDQLGCLSPHVIYAEVGGRTTPKQFARMLAEELEAVEETLPRGRLSPQAAAAIATRRAFYEVRAAHSEDTQLWTSAGSTAWTVIYEEEPLFQLSCLNRLVYVKAVSGLEQALKGADAVQNQVSTVGLAATDDRAEAIVQTLAGWGVTRVCPIGRMQSPPLAWRHDGRPALGDLVTWTDWEF